MGKYLIANAWHHDWRWNLVQGCSIMKDEFYAHSKEGKPPEEWHRLEDHLKNVAEIARRFAEDFNAGVSATYLDYGMM